MTVPEQTRVSAHTGDGQTASFSYGFRILSASDLKVTKVGTDASETVLILGTDYTVSGVGDASGGTVHYASPPAAGEIVYHQGATPVSSTVALEQAGPFPSRVIEGGLDKLTRLIQERTDEAARGIQVPLGEAGLFLPRRAARADKVLGFNEDGTGFALGGTLSLLDTVIAAATDNLDVAALSWVTTITALRALSPAATTVLYVQGYATAGDLGGGAFRWDPASTETANDVTVFAPTGGGTGRWKRVQTDHLPFEAGGAVGDGTTDDSAAIQRCLTHVRSSWGSAPRYNIGTAQLQVPWPNAVETVGETVLVSSTTGVAVTVLGSGAENSRTGGRHNRVQVSRAIRQWEDGTDATSIGIRIENCRDETFHLAAENFRYNIDIHGNDGACSYNTFYLGNIRNGGTNVHFRETGASDPFTNANVFLGGVIRHDSATGSSTVPRIGIDHTLGNGCTWIGTELEGSTVQKAVTIGKGSNVFLNCRMEALRDGAFEFQATSADNRIIGGDLGNTNGLAVFNDLSTAGGNQWWVREQLRIGSTTIGSGDAALRADAYNSNEIFHGVNGNTGSDYDTVYVIQRNGVTRLYSPGGREANANPTVELDPSPNAGALRIGGGGSNALLTVAQWRAGSPATVDLPGFYRVFGATWAMPTLADNAAAVAANYPTNAIYKTPTGELRIVV